MRPTKNKSLLMLISSMCIWGTIGILRRYIPLSSSVVALVRGVIGAAFLILVTVVRKQKTDIPTLRKALPWLVLTGVGIGFNWILLFEAYNYTTVATATLCYYLAPIIMILASPLVLKEKLTPRKILCSAAALGGMVLVSGVTVGSASGSGDYKGILFGTGAAFLYASVVLINKKMPEVPGFDKTVIQLSSASVALLPYVLLTEDISAISLTLPALALLLIAGIIHTGIAYWMYFASMGNLDSHTVALMSYIDPVLAIILSMVFLSEPMSPGAAVGAVLILGAAYIAEK